MIARHWASALFVAAAAAIKNPILPGWNPDAHVLRVDDTYYIAVSSFLTFPGIPIYESQDLSNWHLISHAVNKPEQVPIWGAKTDNGIWAPSLSHINGTFYMTSMAMVGNDMVSTYRTFPRIFWVTSKDAKTWSDKVTWAEPNGIDPELFHDPVSGKNYLNLMGLNNGFDRLFGLTQCEVDLETGSCIGSYRSIWNGTLPVTAKTRVEGPKMFYREPYYYLLAAEGGTDLNHFASVARSRSPEGPFESSPTNPILRNVQNWNLTIGNTGHATFATTPDGKWFTTFLARRYVASEPTAPKAHPTEYSALGRETFFAPVTWTDDGWPIVNGGDFVLMSQRYPEYGPTNEGVPKPWEDTFNGTELDISWYQLRSPYARTYELRRGGCGKGLILKPNLYTLSDRDTPAALMRKQTSYNMTFAATLLPTKDGLGPYQSVGISAYTGERFHQDLLVRGCANSTGLCLSVEYNINIPGPGVYPNVTMQIPLNLTSIPREMTLYIRAEPTQYRFGYSIAKAVTKWLDSFSPATLPANYDGVNFVLAASGNSFPWPYDAPEVGFSRVREEYFEEGFGDYRWKS